MNNIYTQVKEIIDSVYLVGGCVRDTLLERKPKDWDFCTPLLPDEIEERIVKSINKHGDNRKCYGIGKRFGTLGFKLDTGEYIEVTTFRTECYKPNNRKPDVSYVTDIKADLSRRDFTINAIAFDGESYIDPFGGRLDILEKKIKSVGKAKTRIKEDPLRMLRAGRFMSQLNFSIDYCLESEIKKNAYKILSISKERWVAEIDKILMSDNPQIGLAFLMRNDLFNYMIPELSLQYKYDQQSPWHVHDLWTHTLHVVNNATKEDLDLRWAALLHDIGKPFVQKFRKGDGKYVDRMRYIHHDLVGADIARSICTKLKFSNTRTDFVVNTIKNHMQEDSILRQYDQATNDKPKLTFL